MLDWLIVLGIVAVPVALAVIVGALSNTDKEEDEE